METIILIRGGFRFQMRIGCTTFHLGIVLAPAHFQRHMASLDILGYWILATWLRDGPSEVLLHKMCEKLRRFVTESVGIFPWWHLLQNRRGNPPKMMRHFTDYEMLIPLVFCYHYESQPVPPNLDQVSFWGFPSMRLWAFVLMCSQCSPQIFERWS